MNGYIYTLFMRTAQFIKRAVNNYLIARINNGGGN